jgi:hypothetical protein
MRSSRSQIQPQFSSPVRERYRLALTGSLLLVVLLGFGCAGRQQTYFERYDLKNLTIVFLDEESLQAKYAAISGNSAVALSGTPSSLKVSVVRGFFDFNTRTIYCPRMNFEVCGHELHHAALGRFHRDSH